MGLDVVGRHSVAGEEGVHVPRAYQRAEIRARAGVHDRRAHDPQYPAPRLLDPAELRRHPLDEQGLGLLAGDVGGHELEALHPLTARLALGLDANAEAPQHDPHAPLDVAHREGPGGLALDHYAAVHLGVGDRDPGSSDAHVGGEVGGRVEVGGKGSGEVCDPQPGVLHGLGVGAVVAESIEQADEVAVLGRAHANASAGLVVVAGPDPELEDLVARPGVDDLVHDAGHDAAVDEVALEGHDLRSHQHSPLR
jgi:hypothetical protein